MRLRQCASAHHKRQKLDSNTCLRETHHDRLKQSVGGHQFRKITVYCANRACPENAKLCSITLFKDLMDKHVAVKGSIGPLCSAEGCSACIHMGLRDVRVHGVSAQPLCNLAFHLCGTSALQVIVATTSRIPATHTHVVRMLLGRASQCAHIRASLQQLLAPNRTMRRHLVQYHRVIGHGGNLRRSGG